MRRSDQSAAQAGVRSFHSSSFIIHTSLLFSFLFSLPVSLPALASEGGAPTPQPQAVAAFSQQNPQTGTSHTGSRITRVYGRAFGSAGSGA